MRPFTLIPLVVLELAAPLARADYDAGRSAEARGERQRALIEYAAAADRDARAAWALARLHESGALDATDAQQALMWLRHAGDLGDAEAQYELGRRYLLGRGAARREPREAAIWFERAAAQGHAGAAIELNRLLAIAPPSPGPGAVEPEADDGHDAARVRPDGSNHAPPATRTDRPPASRGLPRYWNEREPRVTLHWGVHQGYGNWGWSWWDPYPWYPRHSWARPPFAWHPYDCVGPWCGPYPRSSVHFGWSIGN